MAMSNPSSSFQSCKIVWLIENYCLAISNDRYSIFSPEFTLKGSNSTKWRMILEVEKDRNEADNLSFFLERLTSSGSDPTVVDFEGIVKRGVDTHLDFKLEDTFAVNGRKRTQTDNSVIDKPSPFEPDTLAINCYLIVRDKKTSTRQRKSSASGLKFLSKDLYESRDKYTDIVLKVDGKEIKAHKAILSRNKILQKYTKNAKDDVIQLKELDYEAVSKFVNFLYSGDINYVISEPTVRMARCVEHFSVDLLKSYYASEELNMRSTINVEAHEFHWVISEIDRKIKEEFAISSPCFKRLNVDTTWQLKMSLNSDEDSVKSISLFAEIIEGEKPPYFCLEFGIKNGEETSCAKRILRCNKSYDNMGFKDFVKAEDIKDSLIDDSLRIRFRVRTSDGTNQRSMGCRMMSFVTSTQEPYYQLFSSEMVELLKNENYSDITLKCEDKEFKAHKFVLGARSGFFSKKIKNMSSDTDSLRLKGNPDLLKDILDYIYSGVLKDHEIPKLTQLHNASIELDINSLKSECGIRLKEKNIDVNN